jgi:hypothetical protein
MQFAAFVRTPADEEHFGGILAILHGATGIKHPAKGT